MLMFTSTHESTVASLKDRLESSEWNEETQRARITRIVRHNDRLEEFIVTLKKELYEAQNASVDLDLSDKDIRTLISFTHPDKHGGKPSAVRMTQKLNALRDKY